MDELNEIYKKIQMYLMKKSQECGELALISLCITTANSNHITDICYSITNILKSYSVPIEERSSLSNEKCIQVYKYLLLNTSFNNQERLAEDIISGHLVDMCPPLSPYLFMQIIWNLEYEKILIESLIHVPFDLCIELLNIVAKCCIAKLPVQRSIESVYQLIFVTYTKFLQLRELGIQSRNVEGSIEMLLLKYEDFLLTLTNAKLQHLTGLKKYGQYGGMLKKLICTIRKCLENKTKKILITEDLGKLYNITFGREAFIKCESTYIEKIITLLNEQLMNLLLNEIKTIDCNTYLSWAEFNDEENSTITLQRSIGIECYYFMEFITNDVELSKNEQLIQCLMNVSSKPDPKQASYVLTVQELCYAVSNGKTDLLKELLCRYKDWDRSVIDFIYNNRSLLEKKDCLTLLEYLTLVVNQSMEEDLKELNCNLVTKILLFQSIPDMYEIVMMYLTKHNGKNCLESAHTEEAFHEFIMRNSNLQLPMNLRTILLFLLKNPRMILTKLLKMTIGHTQYETIMISPNDMLLLSSFMQMREDDSQMLVTSILRDICIENRDWNAKKFMAFIKVLLDNSVIKLHNLLNNVFIPYLKEDTFNVSNISSILTSMITNVRPVRVKRVTDIHCKDLIVALAKRMSYLRKNRTVSKYASSEIFEQISSALHYFIPMTYLSASTEREVIDSIESVIEPIDKLHFDSLWYIIQKRVSIIDIIEDYERRCFVVINRLKEDPKTSETLRHYLADLSLLREDFLRHLIIRSTKKEYHMLGSELTVIYWFAFGWNDEIDAYSHFLRLTIEACCLCLEYPSIGGKDMFAFLLKSFIGFCRQFVLLEGLENLENVYQLLIKNLAQLDGSIKHSPYMHLYSACLTRINNQPQDDIVNLLQDVLNIFHHFSDKCLEFNNEYSTGTSTSFHSPRVTNFYVSHELISACMKVPASEAYECIRRMNEIFISS